MNYVPNYKSNFDFFLKITLNTVTEYVYIYNVPEKGPDYSHRNLAKTGFLVTAVRIFFLNLSHR